MKGPTNITRTTAWLAATRSASDRLHFHVRRHLSRWPERIITRALERADEVFADGAGHMQTALDAGIDAAIELVRAENAVGDRP